MAIDLDALIADTVSSSDTSTTVTVADGGAAQAKGKSGVWYSSVN